MPCGQQYAVGVVLWFVSLVLDCGASLRCAASVLELLGSATGRGRDRPRWVDRPALAAADRAGGLAAAQGHRRRLGLDGRPLDPDRAVQVPGHPGHPAERLPEGRPLCHQDMEPIALVPMISSTKQTVAVCLEEAVAQTGVPRVILDDHGADLHGGVEIFREAHPETSEITTSSTRRRAC